MLYAKFDLDQWQNWTEKARATAVCTAYENRSQLNQPAKQEDPKSSKSQKAYVSRPTRPVTIHTDKAAKDRERMREVRRWERLGLKMPKKPSKTGFHGVKASRGAWKGARKYRRVDLYAGSFSSPKLAAKAIDGMMLARFTNVPDSDLNFPAEREASKAFHLANLPRQIKPRRESVSA